MAGYDVVNRELNSRSLGHRGEPDDFPSGSGGNRADAKTPVPQIDGDRAFYFGCTPRDELQPGSALRGTFESQSLQRSDLELLAFASYLSLPVNCPGKSPAIRS